MSKPILDLRFRVPLDAFDLEIELQSTARVLGVFGPSGSGKTTLLESIAGIRRRVHGYLAGPDRVWIDTTRGINLPPHQRDIGFVPQDHLLFPHRSVSENLRFGTRRAMQKGLDCDAVSSEVIQVLELAPLLGRSVHELSGGERQRVALGRALCSGPRLLLLDEPLASLDNALRHRILPFLLRIREQFDIPTLIVSHNPVELLALCDEVVALSQGRVVARGAPAATLTRADVYGSAATEGFENILHATVHAQAPNTTTLKLGPTGEGPTVSAPKTDSPIGSRTLVGIPASDILIATQKPTGLSARNVLPGTIAELGSASNKRILHVDLEGCASTRLAVELTDDAIAELGLAPGRSIWIVVKSNSIVVYS